MADPSPIKLEGTFDRADDLTCSTVNAEPLVDIDFFTVLI